MEKNIKRNGVNVACSVIAVLLLLAPMAAADDVTAVEDVESAVDEPEWIVNRLVIDAQTGEVTEWTDNGVPFTDVRVTGLESATSGYNLWSPLGEPLFLNQSSTYAGYAEFYNQLLAPGKHHVSHLTNSSHYVVVEFDATPYALPAGEVVDESDLVPEMQGTSGFSHDSQSASSSGTKSGAKTNTRYARTGGSSGGAGTGGSGSNCSGTAGWTATKLDEKTLWTPLVVGHAPYKGSGTASTSWNYGKGIFVSTGFASYTYTSSRTAQETIDILDGGSTGGAFQLAKWGYYRVVYRDQCGWAYTSYMSKVIDWTPTGSPWVKTFDLWGASKVTDTDDLEAVTYSGYASVAYKTRFLTKDKMVQTTAGTGVTSSVSSGTYSKFDTTVVFGQGTSQVKTTLQASTESSTAWTYSFPKGDDYCWYVDYLGDGSTGGWAFKYIGSNGC